MLSRIRSHFAADRAAAAAPAAAPASREGRHPWRDNIEAVVMAVVMALFLKGFVVEAYKIPTGSMQPTLIGDEGADVKDRILVDKLSYVVRAPERWEVAVFRYPLERSKSFVKRIAGVGPEELRIEHGDVWRRAPGGAWTIARRPADVMRAHWKRLEMPEEELSRWIPAALPASSRWSGRGRELVARGSGAATFRGGRESIRDDYFDGYPDELRPWLPPHPRDSGQNDVGDLRVAGRIRALPGLVRFTVVLREGARHYRFELPGPAAPPGAHAVIDAGPSARPADGDGSLPARATARLAAGHAVRFAAENLDDRLTLELDGEPVLALAIEPARDQFSAVTLELEGEGADLDELAVHRDVYYTANGPEPFAIPPGHYFMLGDNTQDSSDSREWSFVRYELADGTVVRGNAHLRENPRTVWLAGDDGPRMLLVDEWGERYWLDPDGARRLAPEPAPFVPRAMVQGRALAVFWPLDPRRGIWRLEWVD